MPAIVGANTPPVPLCTGQKIDEYILYPKHHPVLGL